MNIFRRKVKSVRFSLAEGSNQVQGTENDLAKERCQVPFMLL